MTALNAARQGFKTLDVPQAVRDAACQHLESWLTDPRTVDYVPLIQALIDRGAWDLLLDSFYQVIPFGTGGRRGPVGVGPNRINPFTIASSIQGHADYLKARHTGELSVVVAYDVRRYDDARGELPDVEHPLGGITSRDFAELAAEVYAGNGLSVHILDRGATTYMSTPELSFAIRHLGAHGGLNVSASHNPPDDNGAKVYNHLGGQEIPPHDEALVKVVAQVGEVVRLPWDEAVSAGRIRPIGPDVHDAYLATNLACGLVPEARSARVVFTALHGTGDGTVAALLTRAGFQVDLEPTQASHDGAFPNVPFGTPNPEVPESMDRAVELATRLGADLVMSCDPDADRLGLVARHGDGWRFISGNEIATLTVRHALDHGLGGPSPVVIKTEVTSSLVERVAKARGAQVVGHLLVGFKYIGDGIHQLDATGSFHGAQGGVEAFAVGCEESHGVLVTPHVRDKDAAGAALLLAEAASLQKDRGRSLVDLLQDCWDEVGYVENQLISTVMRGAVGRARILAIQDSFRAEPPSRVGDRPVTAFHDRRDEAGPFGPIVSETDRAARDVLVFELGPDARLILRPSGTEPKNKVYAELAGRPGQDPREVTAACVAMAEDFVLLMLARAGLEVPRWALKASGLLPIEKKAHLAEVVVPELARRLDDGSASRAWLDQALADYGKDAVGLVAPALSSWAASVGRDVEALLA